MTCQECARKLLDYFFETLDGAETRQVDEHLAGCERCRATLAKLEERVPDQLGWPDEEPPPGLAERTFAMVREDAATSSEAPAIPEMRARRRDDGFREYKPVPAWRKALRGVGVAALACVGLWVFSLSQKQVGIAAALDGQGTLLAGSTATLRASVFDFGTRAPVDGARLKLTLRDGNGKTSVVYDGPSDRFGTLPAGTRVPDLPEGKYLLTLEADRDGDRTSISKEIALERKFRVLLSTDKPMYQPGQTIHVRALARESGSGKPPEGRALTFTVVDPKGNKVGRSSQKLDRFGVASFDFGLADEILNGAWRVEATLDGATTAADVQVARYSLPKFEVTVGTERPWYRPGDVVAGHLDARYFFGKPVANATVKITAGVFVDRFRSVGETTGTADAQGHLGFEIALPRSLPGLGMQNGSAAVDLSVELVDAAGERVQKHVPLTVAEDALSLAAVPEGGTLVPGVDNRLFVLVARPDGEPAKGVKVTITSELGTPSGTTGDDGIAVLTWSPLSLRRDVTLKAQGADGTLVTRTVELDAKELPGVIRTERTLYTAGETVKGEVLAKSPANVFFLDVVREGVTVATHTVPLVGNRGTFAVDLPADAAGTVTLYTYLPGGAELKRAKRTLFVAEPKNLSVNISADRDSYAPGKDATLTLKVTGDDGKPAAASVGLAVVDESVFALSAKEPALLKAYFLLAEELSKPRFELDPARVVAEGVKRDRAATLLFSQGRDDEISRLISTSDDDVRRRQRAHEEKQRSAEKTGFMLGLAMLGLIFEGALRFAFERLFAGLFVGHPARSVLLALGGGMSFVLRLGYDVDGLAAVMPVLIAALLVVTLALIEKHTLGAVATLTGAFVCVLIGFVTIFGQNIRALFASSANMLGGADMQQRMEAPQAHRVRTMQKKISNFGNYADGDYAAAPEPAAPAAQFAGLALEEGKPADAPTAKDELKQRKDSPAPKPASAAEKASVRVRSWFPETLFWAPSVITGEDGVATVSVPMADSITRWRVSATASGSDGRLGTGVGALRVFQDFFVDLDLPPALTVGDEVEIPVAVHNYLPQAQTVRLEVEKADWFVAQTPLVQEVTLAADEVKGVPLRLKATAFGNRSLTVYAFGTTVKDAIRREVEVRPDGVRAEASSGGALREGEAVATTKLPDGAIAGTERVLLRVYPGLVSAALDGLEGVLRMPAGCFEQTSSTTFPNILVLDWLRRNGRSKPELEMKALEYIGRGYQRLLSFEVPGGGFEWFGRSPANQVLTAYGLLEFADMARVYEVDPLVLRRTQDWLVARQNVDGSWSPDASNLTDGLYRSDFAGRVGTTAYIAWALLESGYRGPATDRALDFLSSRGGDDEGSYLDALVANALLRDGRDASAVLDRIRTRGVKEEKGLRFPAGAQTAVYSRGQSADVETTALAALAFARAGRADEAASALDWLLSARDPHGAWGSTQATVLALRTLLSESASSDPSASADVAIEVAGGTVPAIQIRPETADLVQTVDLTRFAKPGVPLSVKLAVKGRAHAQYQLATYAWVPKPRQDEALTLGLDYDRATLAPDDTLTARAAATWKRSAPSGMVMLALGIPPGFEVDAESVAALVARGQVAKFTLTGKELLLYVDRLVPQHTLALTYKLKARYPVKAKAPSSAAYLYYQPEVRAESKATELIVRR